MNSSTSEVMWPSPVGARENALHINDGQPSLAVTTGAAILTSIGNGTFTASVAITDLDSADVQYVAALLNQGGYVVSNDGSNLVISW